MSEGKITVTVRLIRSFEHRNIKHIVYQDVDPTTRVKDFKIYLERDRVMRSDLPPPFKKCSFDTLKISHQPHGAKTNDPVINRDDDELLILQDDRSLAGSGVVNETELSYFKLEDYKKYQQDPHLVW